MIWISLWCNRRNLIETTNNRQLLPAADDFGKVASSFESMQNAEKRWRLVEVCNSQEQTPETTTVDSNSANTRWVSRTHCGGFVEVAYRVSCSKGETSGCRLPFLCLGFGSRDGRYHRLPGICDDGGIECD